jgi:hypothetical protein
MIPCLVGAIVVHEAPKSELERNAVLVLMTLINNVRGGSQRADLTKTGDHVQSDSLIPIPHTKNTVLEVQWPQRTHMNLSRRVVNIMIYCIPI